MKEIIKTANADYPGLNGITAMVVGYLVLVIITATLVQEVFFWIYLVIALTFVAIVAKKWLEGYQHWKMHKESTNA